MRSRLFGAIGLILLASAGAGCGDPPGTMTVHLLVFSGVPDPTWTLDASDAREADRRLSDLPAVSGIRPPAGRLGYRGFALARQDCHGEETERVEVASGLVVREGGASGDPRVFRDAWGLENWLIELAKMQGHGHLIQRR